jgi:putative toxin-antitoxin system antitoxin component (TIGR02293 family)
METRMHLRDDLEHALLFGRIWRAAMRQTTILVIRGGGPVGWPGSAEVVNMQLPDACSTRFAIPAHLAYNFHSNDQSSGRRRMKVPDTKPVKARATIPANPVLKKLATGRRLRLAQGSTRLNVLDFRTLYQSTPEDRIALIRAGVGATEVKTFASSMGMPQDRFFRMFGIAQATVTRRASKHQMMSSEESEKIVGMAKLVGQVETMLEQSGDPALLKDFDASRWLARWMEEPVPALGGKHPADYMDTIEGQEMVSRLLSMMQTGAYA